MAGQPPSRIRKPFPYPLGMPKTRADGATDKLKKVWAEHVRAAMDKRGLSGREVAQALDVGPQTVSNWRAERAFHVGGEGTRPGAFEKSGQTRGKLLGAVLGL